MSDANIFDVLREIVAALSGATFQISQNGFWNLPIPRGYLVFIGWFDESPNFEMTWIGEPPKSRTEA